MAHREADVFPNSETLKFIQSAFFSRTSPPYISVFSRFLCPFVSLSDFVSLVSSSLAAGMREEPAYLEVAAKCSIALRAIDNILIERAFFSRLSRAEPASRRVAGLNVASRARPPRAWNFPHPKRDVCVSDSTNTATGPSFGAPVGNQTAAIGREVVFSCSVRNIGKYKVMTPGTARRKHEWAVRLNSHTHSPRADGTL